MVWVEEAGPYQPFLEGSIYCLYEADDFFYGLSYILGSINPVYEHMYPMREEDSERST